MSYIDFDEKAWREFQPERANILRQNLAYTTDPVMRAKIQETIDIIDKQTRERRWWQFWKRS